MSRSKRKTPITGWIECKGWGWSRSEKKDKRIWHRRMRVLIRSHLYARDPDLILIPDDREVINIWDMRKEGKGRFDPREHPEWMRK